jgi:hypothetical protein
MKTNMSASRLRIILVCTLIGASGGTVFQALRITGKPVEFRSLAKLVRGNIIYAGAYEWLDLPAEFYTNMVESLESEELKRWAWERLSVSNPELKKTQIKIQVTRTRGSAILNVVATGSEPRGTRIFLDALMDEFIAWRMSVVEVAADRALHAFLQKTARSHEMEPPVVILEKFLSRVEAASRGADQELVAPYLETLQLPLKYLSGKPSSEYAGKAAPDHTNYLDQNVRELEARVHSYLSDAADLVRTTEIQALEQGPHQKQFEQLELFKRTFLGIDPTQIAIQERASPAIEYFEDWRLPIAIGAGTGGLLGGLVGLLLSLLIVRAPRSPQVPATV